jgi:CysZ protein
MARDLLGEETTDEEERNRVPAQNGRHDMFRKPGVGA